VARSSTIRRVPRLLLSAYAASPIRGSEAAVGWNRAIQAARFCDVWLICEETEFGPEIRDYLDKQGPIPGLEFVFVPMGRTWRRIGDFSPLWYLALNRWQKKILRVARRLHAKIGFDLSHHLTFCGYREPGYLWKLGIPHVWGPIGGVQNHPYRFLTAGGVRGAVREGGRNLLNSLQLATSRRVREAGRRSRFVIAANGENRRGLQRVLRRPVEQMVDIGLTKASEPSSSRESAKGRLPNEPLKIVWSGWLTPNKALHLLLEAAAIAKPQIPLEIAILGKGSEEAANRRLAERLGISCFVRFLGWRPHSEALAFFDRAHCFAFTSLRDTTGTVLLEAMSRGVTPICLNHQGASELVTKESGVKIDVTTPRQVASDLASALVALYQDDARLRSLRQGALRRAAEFTWDAQGDRMAEIYRQAIASRQSELALRPELMEEFHQIAPPAEVGYAEGFAERVK
jgi:glycosyltransferase involved in cell wall biosynthesis